MQQGFRAGLARGTCCQDVPGVLDHTALVEDLGLSCINSRKWAVL